MDSRALLIKRYIFLLLAVVCMIYIFANSAQSSSESSKRSGNAADVVTPIVVPEYETHPEPVKVKEKQRVERSLRDIAHASEFAALGVCLFGVFTTFDFKRKKPFFNTLFRCLAAFGFCVVYAVSDEIHQLFVDGRACEFDDVVNDSMGALVGIFLFTLIVWAVDALIKKRKNKKAD